MNGEEKQKLFYVVDYTHAQVTWVLGPVQHYAASPTATHACIHLRACIRRLHMRIPRVGPKVVARNLMGGNLLGLEAGTPTKGLSYSSKIRALISPNNPPALAGLGAPGLGNTSSSSVLVSVAGDRAIIPGWYMQSSKGVPNNIGTSSHIGTDVSTWYHVSPRGTIMAGLLENGVYSDSNLFFSNNLDTKVDYSAFNVPWLYRAEFMLNPKPGQHYFVQTNGITSRGDVYINGELIASKDVQVGSYGGQKYEVTQHVQQGENCILIATYPTNYLRDFAMGFVDWNPYPPDNGTGVWRHVEVSQTGPVSMSPPRIVTDFKDPHARKVAITVKTDVHNSGDEAVDVKVDCVVEAEDGSQKASASQTVKFQPNEEKTVSMTISLDDPQVWWPSSWGGQPLYKVNATASISGLVSDVAEERRFGIRHVTSHVNAYNDTAFTVNGQPFLVMGAGYTPDMFMRFDLNRLRTQFQYVLDMGLNVVRLEGKQEHPEFYDLADRMGLMVLAGWECCDKWEGWTYNDEADGEKWKDADYSVANVSMTHEAAMMQSHPSMLAFLIGSDFWPDDRATKIYVDALNRMDWTNPIIASAAKRGYPDLLGPSGMKMDGPYDWVPPNYWYGDDLGAAFGFGSELGSGVGTPELGSLKKFLSPEDMEDLWTRPSKGLYHMSTNVSSFFDRSIYNEALFARYGKPSSLDDYLLKAQVMDFEATRSEFEAYAARKNAERPSTGAIYWMLNGAWPNLHWQLFDYYLKPAGSYFGAKVGARTEHVSYDYDQKAIYLISHSLTSQGGRSVSVDLIDVTGKTLAQKEITAKASPNAAQRLGVVPGIDNIKDVAFLRLALRDSSDSVLSRNVYWLSRKNDVLDWNNSTWYYTPVTEYSDLKALFHIPPASVNAVASPLQKQGNTTRIQVVLENKSDVPAFFLRMNLLGGGKGGQEVTPVYWSENYVTLWPRETLNITVGFASVVGDAVIDITGSNVEARSVGIGSL
ncbi:hypothetical protein GP486_002545 [Trichoglossum hirsutum]|uniref:Exo-1,4-beta-D-glucosaminidase n=1 Tax=Trichoglossum hirsutum TaxID=265104 RepID=A0A9P8RRK2_9PEZI|nr:hypothetical protein GP486_002545 [Trichoglossum hirsutum]